jgi:CBS domain-containing protein
VTSTGKTAEADTAYIDAGQTLRQAGHLMRKLGVGALKVRGDNGDVQGTISSDMVVRRIAAGGDPKTVTVGEVTSAVSARPRARPAHPAARPGVRRSSSEALAAIS